MYEEAEYIQCTGEWPAWCWDRSGCDTVVTFMFFADECVPETEADEWLEEEG